MSNTGNLQMSTAKLSLRQTQDDAHEAALAQEQQSLTAAAWHAFLRHRSGMIGLLIVLVMLALSIAAPWIAPHDPLVMTTADRFAPPSALYPMGADEFGRDIFSRLLYGGRVAFN